MNKLTLSLALAAGLSMGLAAPIARADAIQSLPTAELSSSTFNSLFTPNTDVNSSSFSYATDPGSPTTSTVAGNMLSQVFEGTGAAAGIYAYAYQFNMNDVTNQTGSGVDLRAANWYFNSTPVGTDFAGTGSDAYAYVIKDGAIGGIGAPQGADGQPILSPTQLIWQSSSNGSLLATYFDPSTNTPALKAGAHSATFVVLTTKPPTTQFAGILGSDPIAPGSNLTTTFSPQPGKIEPIPVPEPSTVLAWAGMAGAVALVRQFRRNRLAVA